MEPLIITAVGPDRPGLVDELTKLLLDAGSNVADSRMVNLRGQFALLMLAEVEGGRGDEIGRLLADAADRLGLAIQCAPQAAPSAAAEGVPMRLRTYAMDQPGIVHRVTHVLHEHRVNIEQLHTQLEAGAHSGTPLFTMELAMTVPATVPIRELRATLDELCDELNCDFELTRG
ncbi:MAG: hypothetical protein CMJ18_14340 [Phycisphaeraceae bacterium]|nr:hypothetical protein [Phycisphaeraceae bacterium]